LVKTLILGSGMVVLATLAAAQSSSRPVAGEQALLDGYCAGCHNDNLRSGGFTLAKLNFAHPEQSPELAEKVIRKLRAGLMPPAGLPRPEPSKV
jgi:mono/diheme cytochrome c family protein